MAAKTTRLWFEKGLKFACTSCGRCCVSKATNVYVNPSELQSMAAHRGMPLFEFVREFTEDREIGSELFTSIKNRDGKCALLGEDLKSCSVHAVKPTQCRTYPFWPGNVVGEAEWLAEAVRCEGIVAVTPTSIAQAAPHTYTPTDIAQQLVIGQIHARGNGENWTYEESRALLQESSSSEGSALLSDFLDEFASTHSSLILFEGEGLRVVDATVSVPGDDEHDALLLGEKESGAEAVSTTTRRLEFVSSPHVAQTEMRLLPSGVVLDHSHLVMPVHRAMATLAVLSAPLTPSPEFPFRVALFGAGGCAVPSFLASHPSFSANGRSFRLAAVEPDGEVLNIAERFFGCVFQNRPTGITAVSNASASTSSYITKHVCTAEAFLSSRANLSGDPVFDLVLVDACEGGEAGEYLAPPSGLLSAHFLRNLAACVSPSGFVAINVLGDVARVLDAVRACALFDAAEVMTVTSCSNKLVLLSVKGDIAGRAQYMAGLLDLSLEGGVSLEK